MFIFIGYFNTENIKLLRASGGADCKKAIMLLKHGRLPEDFIEGMFCPGGCVGGPSKRKTEIEITKARNKQLAAADDRKVLDNIKDLPLDMFSMYTDGHMD